MKWWDYPCVHRKTAQQIDSLIQSGNLPFIDDQEEPWIFFSQADNSSWKPHFAIEYKRTGAKQFERIRNGGSFYQTSFMHLLATRSRLFVIAPSEPANTMALQYTDILGISTNNNGIIEIVTEQGVLRFKIHVVGPGFLNVTVLLVPSSPNFNKALAINDLNRRSTEKRQFMEILGVFLQEISCVQSRA